MDALYLILFAYCLAFGLGFLTGKHITVAKNEELKQHQEEKQVLAEYKRLFNKKLY